MTTTIKKIVQGFLLPSIQSTVGLPIHETVADAHKILNANAYSVQTNLRGGDHGNLALTRTSAVFNTLSDT